MIKKISIILLVSLLILSEITAFGADDKKEEIIDRFMSDNDYMDRVYEYDFNAEDGEKDETVETDSVLSDASQVVIALNIMNSDKDNLFNGDKALTYGDYQNAMSVLGYETNNGKTNDSFITQTEAAKDMVNLLGYSIYDRYYKGENPHEICARKIGILDDIEFRSGANITRNEFAQMIYNILDIEMIEQTSFGNKNDFEKISGQTLIKKQFDSVIIKGIVTAQNGTDMYSPAGIKEGYIKINRALINTNDMIIDDLLSYKVVAILKDDSSSDVYSLKYIGLSEENETIKISSEDIIEVSGNNLFYHRDNEIEKVNISSVDTAAFNGTVMPCNKFFADLSDRCGVFEDFEGELRVSKNKNHERYNSVIGFGYKSFKVARISLINDKIYLDDNIRYKGNSYIDINNTDKNVIAVKDSKISTVESIKAGDIVSVRENDKWMNLNISSLRIDGEISQIDQDRVKIGDLWYNIAPSYKSSRGADKSLPDMILKSSGTFLLSSTGSIVDFHPDNNTYLYGFMKNIYRPQKGLNKHTEVRVFTTDNKWVNYSFADYITIDGSDRVSEEDAYKHIMNNESEALKSLIRYRLNNQGKISFLDTCCESDNEINDKKSIRKGPTWKNKYNWTVVSDSISLTASKYRVLSDAKVFTIPDDPEKEEKYSFSNPLFRAETEGKLQLYNVDDYFVSDLLINMDSASSADFSRLYSWAVVLKKSYAVNEEGDEQLVLQVFDSTQTPDWKIRKFFVDDLLQDEAKALNPGDIILMNTSGNSLKSFMMNCKIENINTDIIDNPGGDHSTSIGTVVSIDAERNLVKVRSKNNEFAYKMHSLGMYDTKTKKAKMIEIGDIQVGDRIFCGGGVLLMRMLIIR